jgi:hypothetical protein
MLPRVQLVFKNSVRTAKKTQHFIITKLNWLMPFKEIFRLHCESYDTQKYKMQSYLSLKQLVHIVATRLYGVKKQSYSSATK